MQPIDSICIEHEFECEDGFEKNEKGEWMNGDFGYTHLEFSLSICNKGKKRQWNGEVPLSFD